MFSMSLFAAEHTPVQSLTSATKQSDLDIRSNAPLHDGKSQDTPRRFRPAYGDSTERCFE